MRDAHGLLLPLLFLSACGGGGGGSAQPAESPGGIWFGSDSASEPVVVYIAETGDLKAQLTLPGEIRTSFGTGLVGVSSGDALAGSFELRGPVPPGLTQQQDLGCAISGTVDERRLLSAAISCSDDNGVVYDESLELTYDALRYEAGSSLDAIAGNYTLSLSPDTNMLNVVGDGTLFGMYDNGARCTVNGQATIIDEAYALIAIDWSFSGCTDALDLFEGVEMSGFAMPNPPSNFTLEGYYFLLTGRTSRGLHVISVLYEPV